MSKELLDIGFYFCNSWKNGTFKYEQWSFKEVIIIKVTDTENINYLKYHYRNSASFISKEINEEDINKMFKQEIREFKLKSLLD